MLFIHFFSSEHYVTWALEGISHSEYLFVYLLRRPFCSITRHLSENFSINHVGHMFRMYTKLRGDSFFRCKQQQFKTWQAHFIDLQ